ncbi:MAG: DUF3788 domain-containing protein [Fibromonadaceae bacterium]|jgi:hypothetical protein|nr:DUF3788 domain-containing protein [Fibromonadaceae bacterium]
MNNTIFELREWQLSDVASLAKNAQNFILEWNYYNDGKSWLGKILNKKKNLCWLSAWNTGFKLTFFFTEKTINGIQELEIDDEIKDMAKNNKPTGKLFPVIILISNKKRMNGCLKIYLPLYAAHSNQDELQLFLSTI